MPVISNRYCGVFLSTEVFLFHPLRRKRERENALWIIEMNDAWKDGSFFFPRKLTMKPLNTSTSKFGTLGKK